MDSEARRRACVEFRNKLSRNTRVSLTAAECAEVLGLVVKCTDELVTLQSNPGLFYEFLGLTIVNQTLPALPFELPNRLKVACFCFREAAEVHKHPGGMRQLALCLLNGRGVTQDPAEAVVWLEEAADLGDAASKSFLGSILMTGDESAGVAEDAPRGFALVAEAFAQGFRTTSSQMALLKVGKGYWEGVGVARDAAYAVTLWHQVADQDSVYATVAQSELAGCYYAGDGVAIDTVEAALWCQRAADHGDVEAIRMLPIIRTCDFCGSTPARKHCERCRKVRYCNTQCQAAHLNRETHPHKSHCRRRTAEASQREAGGASTSAQTQ